MSDVTNDYRNEIADILWELDGSDISSSREYYIAKAQEIMEICARWIRDIE